MVLLYIFYGKYYVCESVCGAGVFGFVCALIARHATQQQQQNEVKNRRDVREVENES